MINFIEYAEFLVGELATFREQLERVMAPLPKDPIYLKKIYGRPYYCVPRTGQKDLYLGKSTVPAVADRLKFHVCRFLLDRLMQMQLHLDSFLEVASPLDLNQLEDELPEKLRYFPRDLYTDLGLIDTKMISQQTDNQYLGYARDLCHPTLSGILVRSKSEQYIADALYSNGIAFEYEPALPQENGPEKRPDFRVFLENENRWVYLEHFGMLSKSSYLENYKKKLKDYIDMGMIIGYDLFCTIDLPNGALDTIRLNQFIDMARPKK